MALSLSLMRTMARGVSTFIAGKPDADVDAVLTNNVLPRIRMLILSATGSDGRHVFYSSLPDVADTAVSVIIEGLIDDLFDETTIAGGLQRVAATLAAASLLTGDLSILESQQKFALSLEKQALLDLDRLIKSPLLKATVATLAQKAVTTGLKIQQAIYLALDGDPAEVDLDLKTVEPYAGAELPFVGATMAGRATLNINGYQVTVNVDEGEKPATTLNKLLIGYQALPSTGKPPVVFGVSEKQRYIGSVQMTYVDPLDGLTKKDDFSTNTEGGVMSILPGFYDATRDVIAATVYLEHQSDPMNLAVYSPGIIGYVYGIDESLRNLTRNGPHSFAADLSQGRSVTLTEASDTGTSNLSDSFFFQVTDAGAVLASGGNLVYSVNGNPSVTVPVSAGVDALTIANLMAQSLASTVNSFGVFGAVRPSATISPQGTVIAAPSLEMIAWRLETVVSTYVVTLQSVPAGCTFALVSSNIATAPLFDARAKSVVIKTELNKRAAGTTTTTPVVPDSQTGTAVIYDYIVSERLKGLLDKARRGR